MTKEEFQKLTQNVVLLDGATGSNLMAAGMPRGICTEACTYVESNSGPAHRQQSRIWDSTESQLHSSAVSIRSA